MVKNYSLILLRWFIVLGIYRVNIPFLDCLKIYFLGMFVSNFLPSTIGGDSIRYLALLRYEDDSSTALSSIISDRLVNIIAMVLLMPISAVIFWDPLINTAASNFSTAAVGVGLKEKSQKWKSWISDLFKRILFLFQSPRQLFFSMVVSWTAQLLYFLGLWFLANALGMSISYLQVSGISVLAYLVTLLPISINGYGVREITITSLYVILGFPIEGAISLAIISRLIYLVTTLPGAIWLPENVSLLSENSRKQKNNQ